MEKENGTINYSLFKIYSQAILTWLKTLDPLYRRKSAAQKVNVIYGNPERVFARINYLPSNERINVPIIGAYITGIDPLPEMNIPSFLRFHKFYYLPSGKPDLLRSYNFSKLKAYSVNYSIDIWAEFKSDIDYIIYTLLREFNNGEIRYLILKSNENFQYIPIKLNNISDNSTYEPGNAADIAIRWSMGVSVLNAFLPAETIEMLYENSQLINEINIQIEGKLNKNEFEDKIFIAIEI